MIIVEIKENPEDEYSMAYEIDKTPLLEYNIPKEFIECAIVGNKMTNPKWKHFLGGEIESQKFINDHEVIGEKDGNLFDPEDPKHGKIRYNLKEL